MYLSIYLSIYQSIYILREGYDVAINYPNIYRSTYLLRKDLNRLLIPGCIIVKPKIVHLIKL